MFWVLKRTVSLRGFFWVPTTYVLVEENKKFKFPLSTYSKLELYSLEMPRNLSVGTNKFIQKFNKTTDTTLYGISNYPISLYPIKNFCIVYWIINFVSTKSLINFQRAW